MSRILLIYDVEGWATWSTCNAIKKWIEYFGDGEMVVDLSRTERHSAAQLAQYDLVFSTIYYGLRDSQHPNAISQISSPSYWIKKDKRLEGFPDALRRWSRIVVKNAELAAKLTDEDHPRRTLLYHVLDIDRYRPQDADRPPGPFRVGFAGHAEQPFRGYQLVREAVDRIPGTQLVEATWSSRVPPHLMPRWYASLDVLVNATQPGEAAGPLPPMEAALCGVPVITTEVGQAGEMFVDGDNALVIERDVDSIERAIRWLKGDDVLCSHLARRGRETISTTWGRDVGESWWRYFNDVIEGRA